MVFFFHNLVLMLQCCIKRGICLFPGERGKCIIMGKIISREEARESGRGRLDYQPPGTCSSVCRTFPSHGRVRAYEQIRVVRRDHTSARGVGGWGKSSLTPIGNETSAQEMTKRKKGDEASGEPLRYSPESGRVGDGPRPEEYLHGARHNGSPVPFQIRPRVPCGERLGE